MKTVKEVREAKQQLEYEIAQLISSFEEDSGVAVSDISIKPIAQFNEMWIKRCLEITVEVKL